MPAWRVALPGIPQTSFPRHPSGEPRGELRLEVPDALRSQMLGGGTPACVQEASSGDHRLSKSLIRPFSGRWKKQRLEEGQNLSKVTQLLSWVQSPGLPASLLSHWPIPASVG